MTDKVFHCKDCGAKFVFSVKSQAFYSEKGWSQPFRCHKCRAEAKLKRSLYSGWENCMGGYSMRKCSRRGTGYFHKLRSR